MGSCFSVEGRSKPQRRPSANAAVAAGSGGGSKGWARVRSSRKEDIIHEQALAAAILYQQQSRSGDGTTTFNRSTSLRYPPGNSKKKQELPRSSSSRARECNDPLIKPHQLIYRDAKPDNVETNHFVLVHGGGFGAWCWYKTIALLEEDGYKVTAVDLTGSGIHSSDANSITSLAQYVKPLTDVLEKLTDGEKVILVGHDFGGACISYAMELCPNKVTKAVFLAATMLTSGQSALDMFCEKEESNNLLRQAQVFLYANGNNLPPTAFDFDKSLLRDLLFNRSPTKDVALASVSMRPIPFAPVLEKLSLSESNYGSVARYYTETLEDNAIPISTQESMVNKYQPEQVFRLKGADHSPFFSKPQGLHKCLVEISRIQ